MRGASTAAGALLLGLGAHYAYRLWRWRGGLQAAIREADARPPSADTAEGDGAANALPRVTVVVPARDEEHTIGPCVDSVLAARYPADRLQVIVVDDDSSDATPDVVRARVAADDRLMLVQIPENRRRERAHKKRAIEKAVAFATGEIILTTDADCVVPPGWVRAMVAPFAEPGVAFVSGPVRYRLGPRPSWFVRTQALDFFGLMLCGAGGIGIGQPNLANGANVAYRRATFERLGGFSGIDGVTSGDDELLMQKMAYGSGGAGRAEGPAAVRFCADPGAVVVTAPAPTWRALVHQRTRWASKPAFYPPRLQRMIGVVGGYLVGLVAVGAAATAVPAARPWALAAYGLRAAADLAILVPGARRFGHARALWAYPLLWLVHAPLTLAAAAMGPVRRFEWKGRVLDR